MANAYLIDINIGDDTQSIARKCNHNFRKISEDVTNMSKSGIRREGERLDADMADMADDIMKSIEAAVDAMEEKLKALDDAISEKLEDLGELVDDKTQARRFAPPVGTYMFSEKSPAIAWPGTTWEQVSEGLYLVSAGTTYKAGTRHGSNKVTLAATQMPQHTHTGPSHTHSGPSHTHTGPSHTHTVPSHTHSVSGTAADSGSHYHWLKNTEGHGLWSGNIQPQLHTGQTNGPWWGGGYNGTEGWADWAGTHSHSVSGTAEDSGSGSTGASGTGATGASGTGQTGQAGTGATGTAGGGLAHENMPASIAVPLWRRTA